MIFTDSGIILFRQEFREADRMVSLYTREHGRLNARLPGVLRAAGKLKAVSEPFACADYRFYVRRGGTVATITGGKINSIFPHIRQDLKRTTLAMHFCELIQRLTPLHQPSEAKYELLLAALTELELGEINSAFAAAFTLRLMTLAGFGLERPVLKISAEFWRRMHEDELSSLVFSEPEDLLALSKCNSVCRRFLNQYLTFPLNTLKNFGLNEPAPLTEENQTEPEELVLHPAH
ncbi:DNA repair protein RecO [Candidatus Avelusimicrobium fimicolum]|jgi:DNA repair protein RecO (recombination protein O)|uniref:DNA repair protein RecO n=1 Tax=Candidatus Avelusimicrobium TaxID=2840538 RepID=UPI002A854241|nr:DNA repair protein RecO [Elusimicrobiaceae bacterium]